MLGCGHPGDRELRCRGRARQQRLARGQRRRRGGRQQRHLPARRGPGRRGLDGAGGAGPAPVCDPTSCQAAGGQCTGTTCVLTENPNGVSAGTQTSLQAGGSADPAFAFLYPYDNTVFPRGLVPPTLQFAGTAPEAMYVHISFPGLDYKGYYAGSNPGRVAISGPMWNAISLASNGIKNEVLVQVTKTSNGQIAGPITESWTIATGNVRGTIYYETYGSAILGGAASVGIMKIQPGATTPTPHAERLRQRLPHRQRRRVDPGGGPGLRGDHQRQLRPEEQRRPHLHRGDRRLRLRRALPRRQLPHVGHQLPHLAEQPVAALQHQPRAPSSPRPAGTASSPTAAPPPSPPTARSSSSTTRTRAAGTRWR